MPHRARRCAWGSRNDFRLPDGRRVGEPGPGERPAAVGGPAGDAPDRLRIICDGFTGVIRHRPLRVGPSPMIKPVPASIRARAGNKLGTVLATSAPCGHNAKTPRWRRASLGFADFKHHRNLFPTRRQWQTRRTQNPVLARGCGRLIEAIRAYIDEHNENPKPFVWTAKAEDILEKVRRARAVLDKIASE